MSEKVIDFTNINKLTYYYVQPNRAKLFMQAQRVHLNAIPQVYT